MGCLPYLKFYTADWLADRAVRMMSPEARGIYWDLLCIAWNEGGIPEKPVELAQWLGVTPKRFERIWQEIEKQWVHGADGQLVNPRQEVEREEAWRVYQQRVENGKKGGRPANPTGTGEKT